MRTEYAFIPKREIGDEFRGFGNTMLREQPRIDTENAYLSGNLSRIFLCNSSAERHWRSSSPLPSHCSTSPAANHSRSSREYILGPRSELPTLSRCDADWV